MFTIKTSSKYVLDTYNQFKRFRSNEKPTIKKHSNLGFVMCDKTGVIFGILLENRDYTVNGSETQS
jgi:hypothetical protein